MTEKDAKMYEASIKKMKRKHPFSWKKYKDHISIVAYLMDIIDKLDSLIETNEEPILKFNEKQGMKIINVSGHLVQAVNMWKKDDYFHSFLVEKVDEIVSDVVNGSYEYTQVMLNMAVVDMNRQLVEYINKVKDEVLNGQELDIDEDEIDDESPISLITSDNSSLHDDQLATIIRMRNEATCKRIIARNAIASMKAVVAYDYIEILRGVDIISKQKRENKHIARYISNPTIKFVDVRSNNNETR